MTRIIGVDPGTADCGFAVLQVHEGCAAIVDLGTFRSDKRSLIRERVEELSVDLEALVTDHNPVCLVVESPLGSRQAKVAAMLWAAYGAVIGIARGRRVYLVSRSPEEWRGMLGLSRRGKGGGKLERKRETVAYCRKRFPGAAGLLEGCPADARQNAWDALAIASTWTDAVMATREATR